MCVSSFFILIIKISLLCNQSMTTVDNHTDHLIRTAPTDDGGDVGGLNIFYIKSMVPIYAWKR